MATLPLSSSVNIFKNSSSQQNYRRSQSSSPRPSMATKHSIRLKSITQRKNSNISIYQDSPKDTEKSAYLPEKGSPAKKARIIIEISSLS